MISLGKFHIWILRSNYLTLSLEVVKFCPCCVCLFWLCFKNWLSWPLTHWQPQLDPEYLFWISVPLNFLFFWIFCLVHQSLFFSTCPDLLCIPLILLPSLPFLHPSSANPFRHGTSPSSHLLLISHLQFPHSQKHQVSRIDLLVNDKEGLGLECPHRSQGRQQIHHRIPPLGSSMKLGTHTQGLLVKRIYASLPTASLLSLPAIHPHVFSILQLLGNFPHIGFWFTACIDYFYEREANKKGKTLKMDFCRTLLANEFL